MEDCFIESNGIYEELGIKVFPHKWEEVKTLWTDNNDPYTDDWAFSVDVYKYKTYVEVSISKLENSIDKINKIRSLETEFRFLVNKGKAKKMGIRPKKEQ